MTNIANPRIEAQSVRWKLDTEQTGQIEVAIPYATIGEQPNTLLLTGLGERDVVGIAESLAERGLTGLAVASLVYPEVMGFLDDSVVKGSIVDGTAALAHDITGNGQPLERLVGTSEGASQAVLAAYEEPELYTEVIAIAPGCLDNDALGKDDKAQAKTLRNRFRDAGMLEMLAGDEKVDGIVIAKEMRGGLKYAANYDSRAVVAALGSKLRIYVGENDTVFTYKEGADAIGEDAIELVPGMDHPTFRNEASCDDIAAIIQSVKQLTL